MELILELADRAGVKVWSVGRLPLVAAIDARSLLVACLDAGVRVLGIEGFYIEGEQVIPEMAAIADFSGLDDSVKSVVESERFLEAVSGVDLFFDFTVVRP